MLIVNFAPNLTPCNTILMGLPQMLCDIIHTFKQTECLIILSDNVVDHCLVSRRQGKMIILSSSLFDTHKKMTSCNSYGKATREFENNEQGVGSYSGRLSRLVVDKTVHCSITLSYFKIRKTPLSSNCWCYSACFSSKKRSVVWLKNGR